MILVALSACAVGLDGDEAGGGDEEGGGDEPLFNPVNSSLPYLQGCLSPVTKERYLELYPDVRAAGMDAAHHYVNWGHNEGRCPIAGMVSSVAGSIVGTHPDYADWPAWANVTGGDNYAYDPANSWNSNYNRPVFDVVTTSNDKQLSITQVAAFAGAIGSVKFRGQELIHAAHGAAFQYHLRYSDIGMYQDGLLLLNECENPTEAGNHDAAQYFPAHYPSASYLEYHGSEWFNGFMRAYSKVIPVDYVPPGQRALPYPGSAPCVNNKPYFPPEPFKISKWVSAGWQSPYDGRVFHNVMELTALVDVPQAYSKKLVQLELVAYLRRWADYQYDYDVVMNRVTASPGKTAALGGEAGVAKIFSNPDHSFAIGMISFHEKGASIARDDPSTPNIFEAFTEQPVLYTASNSDFYISRTIHSDWQFQYPKDRVVAYSFVAYGTLNEVKVALQAVVRAASEVDSSPYDFKKRL